jgi:hypothetical protein
VTGPLISLNRQVYRYSEKFSVSQNFKKFSFFAKITSKEFYKSANKIWTTIFKKTDAGIKKQEMILISRTYSSLTFCKNWRLAKKLSVTEEKV